MQSSHFNQYVLLYIGIQSNYSCVMYPLSLLYMFVFFSSVLYIVFLYFVLVAHIIVNSNSHLYSTGFHNMFKSAFLSPSYRWSNHTHLNKNVLSDFLKVATEGLFLIFTGILFHSFGPHTTKLRSPNLFVHLGMCRSS